MDTVSGLMDWLTNICIQQNHLTAYLAAFMGIVEIRFKLDFVP